LTEGQNPFYFSIFLEKIEKEKRGYKNSLTSMNSSQRKFIRKVEEFVKQDQYKYYYLFGYAGTGKTYVLLHAVKLFLRQNLFQHIYLCSPTHKALNVMRSYAHLNGILHTSRLSFYTIQKLLNFYPYICYQSGLKKFKNRRGGEKFSRTCIIIDECSMISRDMRENIESYLEGDIKIIFVGDPAQLPPIGEIHSGVFEEAEDYLYSSHFRKIVRSKSSQITKICRCLREWDGESDLYSRILEIRQKFQDGEKNFLLYHQYDQFVKSSWFQRMIQSIQGGRNPIILTWRNKTAKKYNFEIRKYIHTNTSLEEYLPNDFIIVNNSYIIGLMVYHTGDHLKIVNVDITEENICQNGIPALKEPHKSFREFRREFRKINFIFNVARLLVRRESTADLTLLKTISLRDTDRYYQSMNNINIMIDDFVKVDKSGQNSKILWDFYHHILLEPYAEITFSHSMTTHKAQGSTYREVYVDMPDMLENYRKGEAKHCIYTAASRASEKLIFII